ncbi:MAG: sigma-70 family RNA polymerase sigma factor [Acidobacteria bacterium]|nr:sigma-70 family RNA polymerase sigma factor [Acidobacteriota bacterium]
MNDLSAANANAQGDLRRIDKNALHPDAMTTLTLGADLDHAVHNQALDTTITSGLPARENDALVYDSSIPVDRMDDHMLIAGTREGDESAFQELVNRYRNPITNFVYRMLNDYDRAVDLAQETFVRVYMNADRYQANYSFSTYIYRIASNLAISELRQRKRRRLIPIPSFFDKEGDEVEIELPDERTIHPDDTMIHDERRKAIAKAIATLPEKYRTAVVLRDVEGRSYEEISDVLGLSDGTVKSRINRARNLLKEKLREFL